MSRLTPTMMVLGVALAAGGCAHHAQKTVAQKLEPKATWKCPRGLYPDLSQPSPNCLSRSPWTQAQVDQMARGGKSNISFSCPAGSFPDATQPMPNCLSKSLNVAAAEPGMSDEELQAKLQSARDEGAQEARQQYEAQLAQKEQEAREAQEGAQTEQGRQAQGEQIEFERRVAFATDSAKLTEASKTTLNEVANQVKSDSDVSSIVVDGHADITGTPELNKKLSEERAQTIASYLAERGVPEDKIETVAHGDENPIASNDNAAGRALNRSAAITAMR